MKRFLTKTTRKVSNVKSKIAKSCGTMATAVAVGCANGMNVMAMSFDTVQPKSNVNVFTAMGKIIGMLLTITRYVGIALAVYGVYEVVMSFTQDEASRKTKGIVMAMAGLIMIAMKTVLSTLGVI